MWQGSGNRALTAEQLNALADITAITNTDMFDASVYKKIVHAERKNQKVVLIFDLDFSVLSKLSEKFPQHKNVIIDTHFKRFYPYNSLACHVIGYVGNIKIAANGQAGLEKIFDTDLAGKPAASQHVVNSVGQRLSQAQLEQGSAGVDIQTTIDITLQEICEKIFPAQYVGSLILLNPVDGAIVSVVSRPSYDPNMFLKPISCDAWNALQHNNPFLNRAFDASYPSGSVFKLITVSAALEHNIISTDMIWDCKGYTLFGNRKYWCGRKSGHGEISVIQAVATSCNTLFFEIGKKMDIDILAYYARKFGLGEKTNCILPEKTGLVPSRDWKFNCKGERWWQGETLSVTIGQSFLLVTPIQIARMIGSIFTGYLVTPRLLVSDPVITVDLDIKPETISFLKKSMKMVIRHGTGRSVQKVKDIKIYGKTSTAQTSDLKKRYLDPKYLEHGWFVCYFQYKDYDPYVLVVMVERVGAAQVATTVAKDFFAEYKKYMDE